MSLTSESFVTAHKAHFSFAFLTKAFFWPEKHCVLGLLLLLFVFKVGEQETIPANCTSPLEQSFHGLSSSFPFTPVAAEDWLQYLFTQSSTVAQEKIFSVDYHILEPHYEKLYKD